MLVLSTISFVICQFFPDFRAKMYYLSMFLAHKGHTHKIDYKSNMQNFGIIYFDELNSNIYKSGVL